LYQVAICNAKVLQHANHLLASIVCSVLCWSLYGYNLLQSVQVAVVTVVRENPGLNDATCFVITTIAIYIGQLLDCTPLMQVCQFSFNHPWHVK